MKILTVGDCHVHENEDVSRFDILGRYIADTQPDVVVFMGDFLTLNCLSAWDRDKRLKMEGRRYQSEIDAGNAALDAVTKYVISNRKKARKQKKKFYTPEWVFIEGNHEDRLTRYLDRDPTFKGFVDIYDNLHLEERGFRSDRS